MLDKEALQCVLDHYALGSVRAFDRYPNGLHNLTYWVETTTGKYTLRIYQYKERKGIEFELAILDLLQDLPVPHPLRTAEGERLQLFEGKWLLIYAYLPGESLTACTSAQLREVGAFLGAYHKRVEGRFVWKGERHKFYDLPPERIAELKRFVIGKKVNHLELLDTLEQDLLTYALPASLSQGPIHVDVKPENVLFENGRLSGVVDFDNSYQGPLLLDLGKTMAWFGIRGKEFFFEDAFEIYRGYISERPLNEEERASLYAALRFAFLSHVFVDYYMFAVGKTSESYFEWIVNVLYVAYKSFTLSKEEFEKML